MSIDRDDFAANMTAAGAGNAAQPQDNNNGGFRLNLSDQPMISGLNTAAIAGAGLVNSLIETSKKHLAEINAQMSQFGSVTMLAATSVATGNRYDAVAVVLRVKSDANKPFLHCIVLEPADGERVTNRKVSVSRNGATKEVQEQAFVGKVIDRDFFAHVQSAIAPQLNQLSALEWAPGVCATSLPHGLLDLTNAADVNRLLTNTVNILVNSVYRVAGVPDMNVDRLCSEFNSSKFSVSMDVTPRILNGIDGVPIFSQGRLKVSTPASNRNGHASYNNGGRNVLNMSLQSSFFYSPEQNNNQMPALRGLPMKRTYVQMLSVSDFDVSNIPSLARVNLGLASLFGAVSQHPEMPRALHRPSTRGESDPWYIGGLEVEANLMESQTPSVWPHDEANTYQDFMRSVVSDSIFFALDVVPHSPQGAFLIDYVLAAGRHSTDNDEANKGQAAHQRIYDAANHLTMGRLGKLFPQGKNIVEQLLPFYSGCFELDGELRPLSAIDTLFVANRFAQSNPNEAANHLTVWGDSWLSGNMELAEKLANRYTIIDTVALHTQRVTGVGVRVVLNSEFLVALYTALTQAGDQNARTISFTMELGNVDVHSQRATASSSLSGSYSLGAGRSGGGSYNNSLSGYGLGGRGL